MPLTFEHFNMTSPVNEREIKAFEQSTGFKLPEDYLAFLRKSNGGEGMIGNNYLNLWPLEQLVELNHDYEVQDYTPELFLIGSNGGGEAIAFDRRQSEFAIVSVPFIGMDYDYADRISSTFNGLFRSTSEFLGLFKMINNQLKNRSEYAGKEIFEIQPIILGGSPTDPANKVLLDRKQHIEAVKFWNAELKKIRATLP